jgi:DME family drug/metabolite transporter
MTSSEELILEKQQENKRSGGIVLLVMAAGIWGTVGVSSALLNRIESTPALTIGFLRLAFSSPFLLGVAFFTTRRNPFKARLRDLPLFAALGIAMASYQLFYFMAIPLSSVTLVVVVALCSAPVIVALLSIPIFKEKLTGSVILALGLALAGTGLLTLGGSSNSGDFLKPEYLLGALLALGAGLSYSSVTILSKLATRHTKSGNSQTMALSFTFAAILLLGGALLTGNLKLNLAPGVWMMAAYLGLIPTGVAYIIFMQALRRATATAASIVTLLEPGVAAFLAWLLLGESVSLLTLAGTIMLVVSVWILSIRKS